MNGRIDCRGFQRKLDELRLGTLPDEQHRLLRDHAGWCHDCGMLLKMEEHLSALSDEELEQIVPDELVDGMYGRVIEKIEEQPRRRFRLPDLWRMRPALVPALSAAVVLLLVAGGWMFGQLRSVQMKERQLTLRVEHQEKQLRDLAPPVSLRLTGGEPSTIWLRDWRRSVAGGRDLTVGELGSLLEGVPEETQVLDAREAKILHARIEEWLSPLLRQELAKVRFEDGIAAAELRRILLELELDEETRVPTARLFSLTKRFPSLASGAIGREL